MAELVMRTFKFRVEVSGGPVTDNTLLGQFSEVSGFDVSYDPIQYRAGDSAVYTTEKFPGLAKYGNITLKRGVLAKNNALYDWINANVTGTYAKATKVVITLEDPAVGGSAVAWELSNVWPTKYTGPSLKGDASELAMETLELAHEGCKRVGNEAAPAAAAGAGTATAT